MVRLTDEFDERPMKYVYFAWGETRFVWPLSELTSNLDLGTSYIENYDVGPCRMKSDVDVVSVSFDMEKAGLL